MYADGRDLQRAVRGRLAKAPSTFPVREVSGGHHVPSQTEVVDVQRKEELSSSSLHIKALFVMRKMAWSMSLLIAIYGMIRLALTLYNSFLPYM